MRMIPTLLACAIVIASSPVRAKPADPVVLPFTGKWEMNYTDDSCRLLARFGEGSQAVVFNLTRFQPGDQFDLTLYGDIFANHEPTMTVEADFGLQPAPSSFSAFGGQVDGKLPLILLEEIRFDGLQQTESPLPDPPPVTPQQERAVTGLNLTFHGKRYRFETGSMGAPMAAMRACLNEIQRHWGYDPAVQGALTRRVKLLTPRDDLLHPNDYPADALDSLHQGLVQFRLDVDETGAITGCNVLYRTRPDEFADITCRSLVKRAKFAPALDAQGQPVKSFYINKVYWKLEL